MGDDRGGGKGRGEGRRQQWRLSSDDGGLQERKGKTEVELRAAVEMRKKRMWRLAVGRW